MGEPWSTDPDLRPAQAAARASAIFGTLKQAFEDFSRAIQKVAVQLTEIFSRLGLLRPRRPAYAYGYVRVIDRKGRPHYLPRRR